MMLGFRLEVCNLGDVLVPQELDLEYQCIIVCRALFPLARWWPEAKCQVMKFFIVDAYVQACFLWIGIRVRAGS